MEMMMTVLEPVPLHVARVGFLKNEGRERGFIGFFSPSIGSFEKSFFP
jgi:hypothetical protein